MSALKRFFKNNVSVPAFVFFTVFFLSLILYICSVAIPSFADWVNGSIGHAVRFLLAEISWIFPFSLAEIILFLLPTLVLALSLAAVKIFSKNGRGIRCFVTVLSVLSLLFSLYVYTLGVGYRGTSLASKMQLSSSEICADDLYETMLLLEEKAQAELDSIEFADGGESVCHSSVYEISESICRAYDRLCEEHPELGINNFSSRAKPLVTSVGFTYLEILGVYSFFTGESNVNMHYPDYTIPFTVAHEFAHQRGIARENEANFVAFLVCIRSEDPYIRYSGYLNMYEYLASALNKTDRDMLEQVYLQTDGRLLGEMRAFSDFYYENKNEHLSEISDWVNDTYLKAQGTEGIISYGLVVQLAVDYYRSAER